ncbi:MAG: apolipoprotein A1/A4/E family protein, partial [Chloroflexota bacterium]|nr:apolipoprotein A1/A4/E family protein [Chloroflexota bacterium]
SPGAPTLPDPAAAVSPREAGVAPETELATPPTGGSVGGDAMAALRDAGVSPATLPRPSDADPGQATPIVGASDSSPDATSWVVAPIPGGTPPTGTDRDARRAPEAATGTPDFTSTGEKGFTASRQAIRPAAGESRDDRASTGEGKAGPAAPITGQGVLATSSPGSSAPPPPLGGAGPASPGTGTPAGVSGMTPTGSGSDAVASGTETASGDPATAHAMDASGAVASGESGDESDEGATGGLARRAAGAVESVRSTLASGGDTAKEKLAAGTDAARATLASGGGAAKEKIAAGIESARSTLGPGGEPAKDTIAAGADAAKAKVAAGVEAVRSSPITGTVTGPDPTGQVARAAKDALATLPPRYAALGLSLLNEGAGQYYNGQRGKAAAFAAAGLVLSTASGMATWLPRDIIGLPGFRLGPRHPRPLLIAAWGALYTYGLWDAWSNAPEGRPATEGDPSSAPAAPEAEDQAGA